MKTSVAVLLCVAAITIPAKAAPIVLTGTYTQDFNTLASSGTSSAVPTGWAFSESGSNSNTTYTAGTGSATAGDTYSFGSAGSSERALGGLRSGSLIPTIGANFQNGNGNTIISLVISYAGEQWRLGALNREDRLDFQYSLNATSLTDGTWTDVNTLDFVAPVTGPTVGALDGNSSANRSSITGTISGLGILDGQSFWLRWTDFNASGSDDGLAVDDFSLRYETQQQSVPDSLPTGLAALGLVGVLFLPRHVFQRKTASAKRR